MFNVLGKILKKIWYDPVFSKVISQGIIYLIVIVAAGIGAIKVLKPAEQPGKPNTPNSILPITNGPSLPKLRPAQESRPSKFFKHRVLNPSEEWTEHDLGFYLKFRVVEPYYKDMPNSKHETKYFIDFKTPESNLIAVELKGQWEKDFSIGKQNFKFSVNKMDSDKNIIDVTLREI